MSKKHRKWTIYFIPSNIHNTICQRIENIVLKLLKYTLTEIYHHVNLTDVF